MFRVIPRRNSTRWLGYRSNGYSATSGRHPPASGFFGRLLGSSFRLKCCSIRSCSMSTKITFGRSAKDDKLSKSTFRALFCPFSRGILSYGDYASDSIDQRVPLAASVSGNWNVTSWHNEPIKGRIFSRLWCFSKWIWEYVRWDSRNPSVS